VRSLVCITLVALASLPRARCTPSRSGSARVASPRVADVGAQDASAPAVALDPLPSIAPDPTPATAAPEPSQTRVIIAGGGAVPSLNQVSLAQDVALARRALTGPALVLYASGPGSFAQVETDVAARDAFASRIASLLDDRTGRGSRHVPAPLNIHQVATAENLLLNVSNTLARSTDPLLLYIAAHGTGGDAPKDSVVGLWEDSELTVSALAAALDRDPLPARPVRVVMTSCFSGGFGEIAFRAGDAAPGPRDATPNNRCGLFAAPWDRESAGCDPNPDRRAQAGFGLHFLHALRGEDRDGVAVDRRSLDYDHDGTISLLDAHTRARIAGRSIDVPTTTSERWLRVVDRAPVTRDARGTDPLVLEEDAVISALSTALSTVPTLAGAESAMTVIDSERRPLIERLDALETRDAELKRMLAAVILARYPVLDDPWHRDFSAQLAAARATLPERLDRHPATLERANIAAERERLEARAEVLDVRAALSLRLYRAHETRALAERARARGGQALAQFARLRACERTAP